MGCTADFRQFRRCEGAVSHEPPSQILWRESQDHAVPIVDISWISSSFPLPFALFRESQRLQLRILKIKNNYSREASLVFFSATIYDVCACVCVRVLERGACSPCPRFFAPSRVVCACIGSRSFIELTPPDFGCLMVWPRCGCLRRDATAPCTTDPCS